MGGLRLVDLTWGCGVSKNSGFRWVVYHEYVRSVLTAECRYVVRCVDIEVSNPVCRKKSLDSFLRWLLVR